MDNTTEAASRIEENTFARRCNMAAELPPPQFKRYTVTMSPSWLPGAWPSPITSLVGKENVEQVTIELMTLGGKLYPLLFPGLRTVGTWSDIPDEMVYDFSSRAIEAAKRDQDLVTIGNNVFSLWPDHFKWDIEPIIQSPLMLHFLVPLGYFVRNICDTDWPLIHELRAMVVDGTLKVDNFKIVCRHLETLTFEDFETMDAPTVVNLFKRYFL